MQSIGVKYPKIPSKNIWEKILKKHDSTTSTGGSTVTTKITIEGSVMLNGKLIYADHSCIHYTRNSSTCIGEVVLLIRVLALLVVEGVHGEVPTNYLYTVVKPLKVKPTTDENTGVFDTFIGDDTKHYHIVLESEIIEKIFILSNDGTNKIGILGKFFNRIDISNTSMVPINENKICNYYNVSNYNIENADDANRFVNEHQTSLKLFGNIVS